MFRLVQACGVRADFVMGHSIGELVAAHVAGVLSLEDACALVAARGQLMEALPTGGAMVSIQASEQEVLHELTDSESWEQSVALAAVNGPLSVVLSGDEDAVLEVAGSWEQRGRSTKRLRVSHAFHSPRMDGMLQEFAEVASGLSFSQPQIPVVSNVTGEVLSGERICDPRHWVDQVRQTVRFASGVGWLHDRGVRRFLEIGPGSVLAAMCHECLGHDGSQQGSPGHDESHDQSYRAAPDRPDNEDKTDRMEGSDPAGGRPFVVVPALRRDHPEPSSLLGALAEIWVDGGAVDWEVLFDGSDARRVILPTYAFQRERYWIDVPASAVGNVGMAGLSPSHHPLLGAAVALANGESRLFTGRISLQSHPWIADHVVMGRVVLPGAAFVELALHVGSQMGCELVQELVIEAPLVMEEQDGVQIQLVVGEPDELECRSLSVYSRVHSDELEASTSGAGWVHHATGVLAPGGQESVESQATPVAETWPPAGSVEIQIDDLYDRLSECGFGYGPLFQGLRTVWRRGEDLFAEVALPTEHNVEAGSFGIHPALLDAALQLVSVNALPEDGEQVQDDLLLPFAWNDVSLHAVGCSSLRVHMSPAGERSISLTLSDGEGMTVARVGSLALRQFSGERIGGEPAGQDSLFAVEWTPLEDILEEQLETGWAIVAHGGSELIPALGTTAGNLRVHTSLESLALSIDGGARAPAWVFVDHTSDALPGVSDSLTEVVSAENLQRPSEADPCSLAGAVHEAARRALKLVQSWLEDERFSDSCLVFVTRGALALDASEGVPGLTQAPIWGLLRSADAENPGRFVLVDVDGEPASWTRLPAAIERALEHRESQLVLREGAVYVPRMARAGSLVVTDNTNGASRWCLQADDGGTLEGLSLVSSPERDVPLESEQLRVAVRAAGLNFRDVMSVLGVYPGDMVLGAEGAGIVLEVGPGVRDIAPGDAVMGLLDGRIRLSRRHRPPVGRARARRLVLLEGRVGAGGVLDRLLRVGRACASETRRVGADTRRGWRGGHGGGADRPPSRRRGVCDGQSTEVGSA